MLTVTIAKQDGTVLFVGSVPEEDVQIRRQIHEPSTATFKMPLRDSFAGLADRKFGIPDDYADSAE